MLALALGASGASAQTLALQTASNPVGYQYQVPSDWVPGSVADPTETYMESPVQPEIAYVVVHSPSGQTPANMAQALLSNELTPSNTQSAYVVTNPSRLSR